LNEESFYLDVFKHLPQVSGQSFADIFHEFQQLLHLYESAIEIVKTQLNILNSEFNSRFRRNPIHSIDSRLKSPFSIYSKLQKKGLQLSANSAYKNLLDIAGVRVTCYYIDDIYNVAGLLTCHDEFTMMQVKDYIASPKPSGYRSYHAVISVPVYLSEFQKRIPVEIQLRTIAMDFWASLEHQLKYKNAAAVPPDLSKQLRECAVTIADTDRKMQNIFNKLNEL